MRDLEKNKIKLWYVPKGNEIDIIDSDGYFTGEKTVQYDIPVAIYISLIPTTGNITTAMFGEQYDIDMVSTSCDLDLEKDALFFYNEPTVDFDTTYDYRMTIKKQGLNSFAYGFKGRL